MKPGPKPGIAPNDALTRQRQIVDAQVAAILSDVPQETRLRYLIEGMIPANQVHLLGGPSGGGKTTLAFQMLNALISGEPFLGRWTKPVNVAYVSGDRPAESVLETQDRCGVSFPIFSAVDENLVGEDLITKIFPRLTATCGGERPDVIYIDGFTAFVPGGYLNNYAIVAKWLASLQRYARKMKITIIGACHTTKVKEGEKFTNPRQRIAGSVAWAGFSETVLIIEPLDGEKDKAKRVVHILPRNHAEEQMFLKFNSEGKLTLPDKVVHQDTVADFLMDGLLNDFKLGDEINYSSLRDAALAKGMTLVTFNRRLARLVEEGKLVHPKKGVYALSQPSEPAQAPKIH
jgi:AAA domain